VKLHYVVTNEKVADLLTKPLSKVKFEYFRDKLGLVPVDFMVATGGIYLHV
jgi:hypothetical protein